MKTIQEIKEEYKEYTKISEVKSKEEAIAYIDVQLDQTDENQRIINNEYKENKKEKRIAQIKNTILFMFMEEDVEFYDDDNKLLRELTLINQIYKNYFEHIKYYIDETNYQEMTKLLEFMILYYQKNSDYIDSKRDNLEYAYKGYYCINNREEDNFQVLDDFFMSKIKELSNEKLVEKTKKIC